MTNTINAVNDIGILLHLPAKVMTELTEKACLCIGSAIKEAKDQNETQLSINIGIGMLSINLIDMQCKFIPSKNLKSTIKTALTSDIDPLEKVLEKAFAERLLAVCEEVL